MNDKEKFLSTCKSVKTGRYGLSLWECMTLMEVLEADQTTGLVYAFNYGFLKGQRANKKAPISEPTTNQRI